MINPVPYRWIACTCIMGAVAVLFGCSTSQPSSYTLAAQLPPTSQQARMVAATIDVNDGACSVRITTLDLSKAWAPVCLVKKDQATYKSFSIAGKQVDFGAVGDDFKVLSGSLPVVPVPAAATAAAAGSSVAITTSNPAFPTSWNMTPYPGHAKLQGQNAGFMITNATLTINGSQGILDVTYKVGRAPLHLECTVIANQKGGFTLKFNPAILTALSPGANYNVLLSSEGASISGNIWDSNGFDTWTPSLPPHWTAISFSAN